MFPVTTTIAFFYRESLFQCEHIFMIFNCRMRKLAKLVSEHKAERCGVNERSECCEPTSIESDLVVINAVVSD